MSQYCVRRVELIGCLLTLSFGAVPCRASVFEVDGSTKLGLGLVPTGISCKKVSHSPHILCRCPTKFCRGNLMRVHYPGRPNLSFSIQGPILSVLHSYKLSAITTCGVSSILSCATLCFCVGVWCEPTSLSNIIILH